MFFRLFATPFRLRAPLLCAWAGNCPKYRRRASLLRDFLGHYAYSISQKIGHWASHIVLSVAICTQVTFSSTHQVFISIRGATWSSTTFLIDQLNKLLYFAITFSFLYNWEFWFETKSKILFVPNLWSMDNTFKKTDTWVNFWNENRFLQLQNFVFMFFSFVWAWTFHLRKSRVLTAQVSSCTICR